MTYAKLTRASLILLTVLGLPAAGTKPAFGDVSFARAWEETITIPTYAPGPCDKNPIFYTGRVYQGAQGRVYPYPLQDVLHGPPAADASVHDPDEPRELTYVDIDTFEATLWADF